MADSQNLGFVALTRFGYGARGDGDLAAASSDPRGFLKSEIAQPGIALLDGAELQKTSALLQAMFADQERVNKEREAVKLADATKPAAAPAMTGNDMAGNSMAGGAMEAPKAMTDAAKAPPKPPSIIQQAYRAEALARIQRAISARAGLVERLVAFWSNHFCVSARKSPFSRITCGSFEREAIRPHVFGRFSEMLRAVEQHPAMLHFLDNQQSIGPGSKVGQNRKLGLNENLAREIMELHTMGAGSGYTQTDVTTLARIITGWTVAGREGRQGEPGGFFFNANAHEPGAQTLLGKSYAGAGQAQGEAALDDIARHPATARFVATKLARHFIADAPPAALVQRLAKVFADTQGDLRAATMALVDADESWSLPLAKIRTPYEFLIAAARMTGRMPENADAVLNGLGLMGMPFWEPPGPNGWPDTVAAWASPEGLKQRLDLASQYALRLKDLPNPSDLLERIAGDAASHETRQAVSRAESRQQGLALLLMSPELQRR